MLHDECSRPPCGFFRGILDRLIGKLSLCRYLQLIYFENQNMQTYIYSYVLHYLCELNGTFFADKPVGFVSYSFYCFYQ